MSNLHYVYRHLRQQSTQYVVEFFRVGLDFLGLVQEQVQEQTQENCRKLGNHILAGLNRLKEKYPIIGDVRGKGLMLGIEFVKDRGTKIPGKEECSQIVENARELGLLLGKGGLWGQTIRFAPPMNITCADAEFLLAVLDESIAQV